MKLDVKEMIKTFSFLKLFLVNYFIPLSAAPVSPTIGDVVYSNGTNTDNTFGSASEGLFRFGLNGAWHKVG